MIILSENLIKYERILTLIYQKGDRISESLYLDFKNKFIYFQSERFIGKMKFDFKMEDGEVLPNNFWVNAPKFLILAKSYSELLLTNQVFYNPKNIKEKFIIDVFEEEFEDTYFVHKSENWSCYDLSEETLKFLRESYPYTSDEYNNNFKGVYMDNHNLIATDRTKFFCTPIVENFENFYLHIDLIKVILPTNFDYNKVIIYYKNDNTIISLGDSEFDVLSSEILDFQVPLINDPDFISNYDHEDFITFAREDLQEILRFMDFFIKDLTNKRICISITVDAEKALINPSEKPIVFIESIEEDQIKRELSTIDVSPILIGKHFYFPLPYFQIALNTFKEEEILKLQIDSKKIAVNFTAVDSENTKHVVISRIEE